MKTANDRLPSVTAIIPTMCHTQRRRSLMEAIDSLISQSGAIVRPLVVVNGRQSDEQIVRDLQARTDTTVVLLPDASLPAARRAGRELVRTEFFCFLDDDDVYLPAAMEHLLAPMVADPTCDVVVGNGYVDCRGRPQAVIEDFASVVAAPVQSLMRLNWLASAAALYRTSSIPADFLDDSIKYYEWTLLAFRIVSEKRKVAFVPAFTYRLNDTPGSLSKTSAFFDAEVKVLRRILELQVEPGVRRALRSKLGRALHVQAERQRAMGDLAAAWRTHIGSMATPDGFRNYILYTRKLLRGPAGARKPAFTFLPSASRKN